MSEMTMTVREEDMTDTIGDAGTIGPRLGAGAVTPAPIKGKNLGVYLTPSERAELEAEAAAAGLPVNRVMRAAIGERVRRMRAARERKARQTEVERTVAAAVEADAARTARRRAARKGRAR